MLFLCAVRVYGIRYGISHERATYHESVRYGIGTCTRYAIHSNPPAHARRGLIRVEKGYVYLACFIHVSMRLNKEARQVNSLNLKRGNIGIANMHKGTADKIGIPGRWVIYQLGDVLTSVLPLGSHASTSPILSQRYPSIRAVPPHKNQLNCL